MPSDDAGSGKIKIKARAKVMIDLRLLVNVIPYVGLSIQESAEYIKQDDEKN